MNIVLHIGLEKTGTTTIQQCLAANRAALAAQGVLFPISPGATNQTRLAAYALADEADSVLRKHLVDTDRRSFRRDFRQAFHAEVRASSCTTLLLSNEHCSSRLNTPAEVARLKKLLDTVGTVERVIVYLRRQDEFLLSSYSTAIKNGIVKPFAPPHARKIDRRYDFREIVDRWAAAFGEQAIRPRIFAREDFVAGDLLADFCASAGIARAALGTPPEDRNLSLSAAGLEMLRLLNAAVPREARQGAAQREIVRRVQQATPGPRLSLSSDARRRFLANFEDSNDDIRRRFFPERAALFAPVADDIPEVPLPDLDRDAALAIAARLLRADPGDRRRAT